MSDKLGIRAYGYVEFYVGLAKMALAADDPDFAIHALLAVEQM